MPTVSGHQLEKLPAAHRRPKEDAAGDDRREYCQVFLRSRFLQADVCPCKIAIGICVVPGLPHLDGVQAMDLRDPHLRQA
jgi:hypothetical protein